MLSQRPFSAISKLNSNFGIWSDIENANVFCTLSTVEGEQMDAIIAMCTHTHSHLTIIGIPSYLRNAQSVIN